MTDFERFKKDFESTCELVAKIGIELSHPTKDDKSFSPEVRSFYVGIIDAITGSLLTLKDFVDTVAATLPIFDTKPFDTKPTDIFGTDFKDFNWP